MLKQSLYSHTTNPGIIDCNDEDAQFEPESRHLTSNGYLLDNYYPLRISDSDYALIDDCTNFSLLHSNKKESLESLLATIQSNLDIFKHINIDVMNVPLRYSKAEEGLERLEWCLPNFRVGFNLEEDDRENSWYIVSNGELGNINATGFLKHDKLNHLLLWFLLFILIHHR